MLRMASFPPDRDEICSWFANHQQEWVNGTAYRFAVERHGAFVGIVDVDEVAQGEGSLGYWFARASWGQGYAFEAACAVVRFAFGVVGLSRLRAGHAADNPASGRVLIKLGFRPLDSIQVISRSRGEIIVQRRYLLPRPDAS